MNLGLRITNPDTEIDMFSKGKDDQDAAPLHPAKVAGQQAQQAGAAPARVIPAQAETVSSIGVGMTVVGKVVGDGNVKVFGRVEGELQVSSLLIGEGAEVEGNIVAKDLTISGRVKGTIHAVRVKLSGSAVVEGDIFHRSLAIEENARFEGTSRREDNLTDRSTSAPAMGSSPLSQTPPQIGLLDGNGRFNEQHRQ
jgi:cytoskeletal protein CcmA (bactofilin family)